MIHVDNEETTTCPYTLGLQRRGFQPFVFAQPIYNNTGQYRYYVWMLLGLFGLLLTSAAADLELDADKVFPQMLTINRGDSITWRSPAHRNTIIESFDGELNLELSQNNDWSATFHFEDVGTSVYQRFLTPRLFPRSGIIVVRDWTNAPPTVTINAPQEGDIFNCCAQAGGDSPEPIPLMATPTIETSKIDRVEFLSSNSIVATVTNAPYFVTLRNLPPGNYNLTARVIERSGIAHESAPVHIRVEEVLRSVLTAKILRVKDQDLVMVSWLETPHWAVMSRDGEITSLGTSETSSTSVSGVRFWIERPEPGTKAFFRTRRRF